MATNSEVIAKALAEEGIKNIFGLPGGESLYLIDACRREGICFHLVGHESSASFMADVDGQLTGRAGVCIATLGPGAMNLVSGVASAYMERSPVLAITAETSLGRRDSFPHQRLPLNQIFAGITKQSIFLDGVDTDIVVKDALALARSGRPGPVHLALTSDLSSAEVKSSGRRADQVSARDVPSTQGEDEEATFKKIVARIREAKRPLVVIGIGARPADAPDIRTFLDVAKCPWVTMPKAKGIAPETHERFLGVAGGFAIEATVTETVEMSDLLIGIGFDPVECKETWFMKQPVVNINRWTTDEPRYNPLEMIVGDIGQAVARLGEEAKPAAWPADLLAQRRQAIVRDPLECKEGLSPLCALRALREALPEDAIASCDVGNHKLLSGQFWQTTVPQTFLLSHGLSSMGYGVPAAYSASLHSGGRPSVAIVGDGGMIMMASNLPLIASSKLPILLVVYTEGSLGLIRLKQERRGLESCGTSFTPPDFVAVARAHGMAAARAESIEDVKKYADLAIGSGEPFLLEVPVDYDEYTHLDLM